MPKLNDHLTQHHSKWWLTERRQEIMRTSKRFLDTAQNGGNSLHKSTELRQRELFLCGE